MRPLLKGNYRPAREPEAHFDLDDVVYTLSGSTARVRHALLVDGLEAAAESKRAAEGKAAREIARLEKREKGARGVRDPVSLCPRGKKEKRRNVQKAEPGDKKGRLRAPETGFFKKKTKRKNVPRGGEDAEGAGGPRRACLRRVVGARDGARARAARDAPCAPRRVRRARRDR